VPAEPGGALLERHLGLLAERDHAAGEVVVVLHHEPHGDLEVVDVVEHQSLLGRIGILGLEERERVLAPVTERVEVVRCVVAVVVAEPVALFWSGLVQESEERETGWKNVQ